MLGKVLGNGVALTWSPKNGGILKRLRARSTTRNATVTITKNGQTICSSIGAVMLAGHIAVEAGATLEVTFSGMTPKSRGLALLLGDGA